MGFENQDVERKVLAILTTLGDSRVPVGSRIIAKRLKEQGVDLGERAVRYHLKLMDERGLTELVGRRDGRTITELGHSELKQAMVAHKVGSALSRIEILSYRTTFDIERCVGEVPVNVSFFAENDFNRALQIMKPVFKGGFCVSDLVAIARNGDSFGDLIVPEGKVGLATVCSIVINGTLLKAGIPIDSKFGGILQMKKQKPLRFVELIHYEGSSLDPTEIFIRASMTSVSKVVAGGDGEILANYRELPAICKPLLDQVREKMKAIGINGILVTGNVSEPVCEVPIELNKVGLVLMGGLNPVAAAVEAGIPCESHAMSTVIDYGILKKITEVQDERN